ncbi:MAG: hypothetical protein ACI4T1_01275 [Christensenellales bacterium]
MEEEIKIYDDYTIEIPSNEIETDLNNNLKKSKDLKTLEKNDGIPYEKLDKEIRAQEESRKLSRDNISNFAKSQKPKKTKNKVLLWSALGAMIASAAVGGLFLAKNSDKIETYKYNRQIEKVYKEADKTIKDKIFDNHSTFIKANVDMIRIQDPKEDADVTNVFVYYSGDSFNPFSSSVQKRSYVDTYETQVKYYNSLVNAEESGDMLSYISCLNEIFETMALVNERVNLVESSSYAGKIEDTKENQDKINDLFALDIEDEDIIRQIGFLPTEVIDSLEDLIYNIDEETGRVDYTIRIGGISYCETKSENYDIIENGDGLVMTSDNYDSNHVKAYYRVFELSSSVDSFYDFAWYNTLGKDVLRYLNGEKTKSDIQIKTVTFERANILDGFIEMRDGNFNFKLPDADKTKTI